MSAFNSSEGQALTRDSISKSFHEPYTGEPGGTVNGSFRSICPSQLISLIRWKKKIRPE